MERDTQTKTRQPTSDWGGGDHKRITNIEKEGEETSERAVGRKEGGGDDDSNRALQGFNQPNYSLITEAQNVEQLTHTHTHTHTHTCNRSSLMMQTRWKLHRQTDDKNQDESPSGDSVNECTVCCFSNCGGGENFLPLLAKIGSLPSLERQTVGLSTAFKAAPLSGEIHVYPSLGL